MQLDFKTRELQVKLVYYGPALSGKTTNLQALHKLVADDARGRLMALETRDDRTLFFDLLPLSFSAENLHVRVKLFTVPGQVIHNATRKLVLQGADGVAFIADSQRRHAKANTEAFVNLRENLTENGFDIRTMPMVIQFNKRDLGDVRSDREIDQLAAQGREPVFKAIATQGVGVPETFLGLFELTWKDIERKHQLSTKFGIDENLLLDAIRQRVNAHVRTTQPPEVR